MCREYTTSAISIAGKMGYINGGKELTEAKELTTVKISTEASGQLDKVQERTGVNKQEIVTRAAAWMARQEDSMLALVLGQLNAEDEAVVLEAVAQRIRGAAVAAKVHEEARKQKPGTRRPKSAG